jgi:hypothetical protein
MAGIKEKTEALEKPATEGRKRRKPTNKKKRPEPKVTMTIIRVRREDDPVGYARFCDYVKRRINGLPENPGRVKAKNEDMCATGDEGIDNGIAAIPAASR